MLILPVPVISLVLRSKSPPSSGVVSETTSPPPPPPPPVAAISIVLATASAVIVTFDPATNVISSALSVGASVSVSTVN